MKYSCLDVCRALLFVPANRARMVEKAPSAGADVIVLDLEDAVPPPEKATARKLAKRALQTLIDEGPPVFVRINHATSRQARADVMAVVRPGLAGILYPKTEHPQELRDLDVVLREAELRNRVRPGDTAVVPIIESPRGLLECTRIVTAVDRIAGLALGGEDYTAALGVPRGEAAFAHPRSVIVNLAAAHGLAAIDTPHPSINDERSLAAEAKLAASIGFRGKFAIHPVQVQVIRKAFSPSPSEVADARRIVSASKRAERSGKGAVALDGKMIDAPIVARALRIIAVSERG